MKAKDLAALAALGVAGFAAYDKFGKKDAPASGTRAGAKLGESGSANDGDSGEREARMNMRDMNEGSGRRDAGGSTEDVDRRRSAPERMRDIPESRQERDVPEAVGGFYPRDKEGLIKRKETSVNLQGGNDGSASAAAAAKAAKEAKDAKAAADAAAKSNSSKGGPSRSSSETVASADYVAPRTAPRAVASTDYVAPRTAPRQVAADADYVAPRTAPRQAAASTDYVAPRTAPKPVAALSPAAAARQTRIDESNFDSDLMKGRRQAVVDTVKNIPANVANAFKPLTKQEIIDQKNYDSQLMRDRREAALGSVKNLFGFKKGGAVKKMASGGLASSRMSSKPSTASSRGDGIAQRGKTRGQMR
jgi:hypothetical protein